MELKTILIAKREADEAAGLCLATKLVSIWVQGSLSKLFLSFLMNKCNAIAGIAALLFSQDFAIGLNIAAIETGFSMAIVCQGGQYSFVAYVSPTGSQKVRGKVYQII